MLLLAGCADPYEWPHTYNVPQANQANLAAEAYDWRDLRRGHGDPGADGQEASAAVDRLRRGTVKELPLQQISDLPNPTVAAPAPGAAPSSGGAPY